MVRKLLVIAGGVIVGVVVLSRRDAHTNAPAPAPVASTSPTTPQRPPLVGTAILAVKRFLNDPGSSSFPSPEEWTAVPLGSGRWRVSGEVTATNGFSARVRQPVVVEMVEDGENMRVTFVKLGEQVVYGAAERAGGR